MDIAEHIAIEDEPPDLVLSFLLFEEGSYTGSLILHRAPALEQYQEADECGVDVWLDDDEENMFGNKLLRLSIDNDVVTIAALRNEFMIDISRVERADIGPMINILNQMNFDSIFELAIDSSQRPCFH